MWYAVHLPNQPKGRGLQKIKNKKIKKQIQAIETFRHQLLFDEKAFKDTNKSKLDCMSVLEVDFSSVLEFVASSLIPGGFCYVATYMRASRTARRK